MLPPDVPPPFGPPRPRPRVDVLRERVAPDRALVERAERVLLATVVPDDAAAAPPVELLVEREPADLARAGRLAVERLAVDRAVLDFAREPVDADLRPADDRPLDERPLEPRADPDRDDEALDEPDDPSSAPHLPVMTRWAASATASAMMLPSLVALDIMLVAACEAVSAASRPASRILRRALGLALIAAAAAAKPAASISLLIAALAILSIVSLPDEEPDDPEPEERLPDDPVFGDFAIVTSSKWYG